MIAKKIIGIRLLGKMYFRNQGFKFGYHVQHMYISLITTQRVKHTLLINLGLHCLKSFRIRETAKCLVEKALTNTWAGVKQSIDLKYCRMGMTEKKVSKLVCQGEVCVCVCDIDK